MGKHGTSHWDSDWEAAITPNGEDSLYGSSDGYQAVNDWSGVYEAQPQNGFYEQGAVYDYEDATTRQPVMDQSYYESVYAAYSAPPAPQVPQAPQMPQPPAVPVVPAQHQAPESSPMWDGPGWQDPYAQYGQAQAQVPHQARKTQAPHQTQIPHQQIPHQQQAPVQPQYDPQYQQHHPHYDHAYEAQQAQPQQPPHYAAQPQAQPRYEDHNFHHPDFDTGTFEAIYEGPESTEASYDLLPDGEGSYDAYDGEGYGEGD